MADQTTPDLSKLVLRAQQRDAGAFAALYRDFARVVHGIVVARCGPGRAEDLTQDVFVTAFERRPELRDPAAFEPDHRRQLDESGSRPEDLSADLDDLCPASEDEDQCTPNGANVQRFVVLVEDEHGAVHPTCTS